MWGHIEAIEPNAWKKEFVGLAWKNKGRATRRERFLAKNSDHSVEPFGGADRAIFIRRRDGAGSIQYFGVALTLGSDVASYAMTQTLEA